MPIRFDNQAAAGMVGAFAAGMGRGDERRRREQLALIERQRERLFQAGMQQQELGARVQLQNAGFANQARLQQAGFGQQQQMNQQEFQQHQLLQEAGFANQGRLQEAGFANQQRLQTQEAIDRERLFGIRSEQDLIEAAHKDIREGKSVLSPENRSQLNYVRELRDATIRDPNIPEDQRRAKLAQLRQAEARILTTAEPTPKPPMPQFGEGQHWPSGTPGVGSGYQWDPTKGKWEHLEGNTAEQNARAKELATARQELFKAEQNLANKKLALRNATGGPNNQKLYTTEEAVNEQAADHIAQVEAARQRVAQLSAPATPPVSGNPLGHEALAPQPTTNMTAPVGTQGANAEPNQGTITDPMFRGNWKGTSATPVPVQTQADIPSTAASTDAKPLWPTPPPYVPDWTKNIPQTQQATQPTSSLNKLTGNVEKTAPPQPGPIEGQEYDHPKYGRVRFQNGQFVKVTQ